MSPNTCLPPLNTSSSCGLTSFCGFTCSFLSSAGLSTGNVGSAGGSGEFKSRSRGASTGFFLRGSSASVESDDQGMLHSEHAQNSSVGVFCSVRHARKSSFGGFWSGQHAQNSSFEGFFWSGQHAQSSSFEGLWSEHTLRTRVLEGSANTLRT